jgi:hypothetical protein
MVTFLRITISMHSDTLSGIGTTGVNFLAIVFQIFYGPGALLGIIAMKKYDLRGTLIMGTA